MVHDINISTPNNQVKFKSLLGYTWYYYSDMSVVVVGYDFQYDPGPCLCAED